MVNYRNWRGHQEADYRSICEVIIDVSYWRKKSIESRYIYLALHRTVSKLQRVCTLNSACSLLFMVRLLKGLYSLNPVLKQGPNIRDARKNIQIKVVITQKNKKHHTSTIQWYTDTYSLQLQPLLSCKWINQDNLKRQKVKNFFCFFVHQWCNEKLTLHQNDRIRVKL